MKAKEIRTLLKEIDCYADFFIEHDGNLNRWTANVVLLQDYEEYTNEVNDRFAKASTAVWDALAGTGISPNIICRSHAEEKASPSWKQDPNCWVRPKVWGSDD